MKLRGFEIAKGFEDKGINLPVRKTKYSAGYDVEAAEDIVIPMFTPGCKPTLIPTGLKAYCQPDECYLLLNRSSGPKKGFLMANSVGLIDYDYYENPDNDGHFFFALYIVSAVITPHFLATGDFARTMPCLCLSSPPITVILSIVISPQYTKNQCHAVHYSLWRFYLVVTLFR